MMIFLAPGDDITYFVWLFPVLAIIQVAGLIKSIRKIRRGGHQNRIWWAVAGSLILLTVCELLAWILITFFLSP
jgi:predicted Co/Zn/Cd cation transporter (cation efflux family)